MPSVVATGAFPLHRPIASSDTLSGTGGEAVADGERRGVTVHLYSIVWNEEPMLPWFFRHYDRFVDRYVIFDDGSTDRTRELLSAHPRTELRDLPRADANSYVISAQAMHDAAWKESRGAADWVIWTAVDEHLVHRDLPGYLGRCRRSGVTAVPALGFQMVSRQFPPRDVRLCEAVTRGAPFQRMSKLSIFDPDAIEATAFGAGRHEAVPQGRVRYPPHDEVLNLHFKYIDFEYLVARNRDLAGKLGSVDRANRWGHQYDGGRKQARHMYGRFEAAAFDLAAAPLGPAFWHLGDRWWRPKGGGFGFRLRRSLMQRLGIAAPASGRGMASGQGTPTPL